MSLWDLERQQWLGSWELCSRKGAGSMGVGLSERFRGLKFKHHSMERQEHCRVVEVASVAFIWLTFSLEKTTQGQEKHASGGVVAKSLGATWTWKYITSLTVITGPLNAQSIKTCAQRGNTSLKRNSKMSRVSVSYETFSQGPVEAQLESQQKMERKTFKGIFPKFL